MSRILLLVLSAALFLCPAAADKPANFEKVDPANNDYAQGAAKREKEEEAEVFKLRSLEEATDVMAVVWEELDKPAAAARIRAIAEAGNHPAELTPALAGFLKRVLVQLRLTAKEEFPGARVPLQDDASSSLHSAYTTLAHTTSITTSTSRGD